jgi:hypothetical protein
VARHFREAEGLSIAQIAERMGRSSATVKAVGPNDLLFFRRGRADPGSADPSGAPV